VLRVSHTSLVGVVLVGLLATASEAPASRSPTPGEEDSIRYAFRDAHYQSGDGVSVRSIREIRVSMVDDRWAAVLYRRSKGGSKKLGLDFFRRKGEVKWKKGEPPGPVAADLRQPAEPVLADIRYRGSGSLRYDYAYDDGAGDTQSQHAGVDFSWDYEWRGVEIADFDIISTPDRALAEGTWEYSYTGNTGAGCTDSGALRPDFEGVIDVDRDGTLEAQVRFEDPFFRAPSGCTPYDLWGYVIGNLPSRRHDELPTLHGVPTFPTEPVEQSESSAECTQELDPVTETCTFTYSATMSVTPR
jgi:hypothetical protein